METFVIFLVILILLGGMALFYNRSSRQAEREETKQQRAMVNKGAVEALDIYLKRNRLPIYQGSVPVMLKHDEHAIACSDARFAEERSVGNSSGMSFRVASGMYYRTGQSRGTSELRVIDQGRLVLTTKRLVFVGDKRTSISELQKVVNVQLYSDAITVHKEGKAKAETYFFDNPAVYKLIIEALNKFRFIKEDNNTLVVSSNHF